MRQEDILGHARGLVFAIVSARASRLFLILVCFGGG